MELWIRSQDKETLIKSYELYIRPYSNIYVIRAKRTSNIMGLYKSKERALEVLNEIHEHIEKHGETYIQKDGLKHYGNVYQMPEE